MIGKAQLKWSEEFDCDFRHYRAEIIPGRYYPYFWLCDMNGGGRQYGVSVIINDDDDDDDEILVDGDKLSVPLPEAKAVAERHLLTFST